MTDSPLFVLTLCSALGWGLVAGAFFAFSTFIMKALGRLPPGQGIAAMQSINVTVINPAFMGALFGTAAACVFLAVTALQSWQEHGEIYLLAGSLLYVLGTVGVTMVFNVPLNNALAAVAPDSAEGARLWRHYLARWTAWNHVRTVAALASAAGLTVSLWK
jgi:uncharacterized membrane protein